MTHFVTLDLPMYLHWRYGAKIEAGELQEIFSNHTSVPVHTTNRLWPQGWTLTHAHTHAYLHQNNFKPDVRLVAMHLV